MAKRAGVGGERRSRDAPGAPPLRLLTSPSAARLMEEVTTIVLSLAREHAAVALVVPTTRLLEACQRALLRAAAGGEGGGAAGVAAGGIVAGVHLMHHRSLAAHVLGRAWVLGVGRSAPPRLLSEIERAALVQAAIGALPGSSEMRRLCGERPRFAASLLRTLGELREAGVTAEALARRVGRDDDLARLHAAHESLLEAHEAGHQATDGAGHARLAAQAARALGERGALPWTHLVHHGSYELVGVQAALVEAVSGSLPTWVLALSGEGPAHETSRQGLLRHPGPRAERIALSPPHQAPTLLDTESLCDEDADPARDLRLPDGVVLEAFHVRGARAEAELAARLAAEAHLERGVPLEEIGVVARSLDAHAAHLQAAFDAHGVPFTTSATAPLLREPWARAAATLLDALAEELPRPLTCELLRSPWARLHDKTVGSPGAGAAGGAKSAKSAAGAKGATSSDSADGSDGAVITPDLWNEWTLAARVVRGAASLRDDVLAWHEADLHDQARRRAARIEDVRALPQAGLRRRRIEALGTVAAALEDDRLAWSRCRLPGEHALTLRAILARWLREPEEGSAAARSRAALHALLDDLERLDGWAPGEATVESVRALLSSGLAGAGMSMGTSDGSGVRVLSAMPARGVPFREMVIIGLTQGAFPRRPRQDPFLPDEARLALRTEAPALSVKREARDEERQILAVLLGAATQRLHVTWQRADDDGGARAPSLFLREIARLVLGRPDLGALVSRRSGSPEAARLHEVLPLTALPGHPALAAIMMRERFGRATFRDALLEAAERPQRRRIIQALARGAGRLDAGLEHSLAASVLLESFTLEQDPALRSAQLAHDGVLGPGVVDLPSTWSASALQLFGRCSLQWLFTRGFGIPQPDEEPDPLAVASDEMGTCVHAALEAVHLHAIARGGDPAHLATAEATAILRGAWERELDGRAGARRLRAPLAWEVLSASWLATLERFLEKDARRLAGEEARIVAAETNLAHAVEIVHDGRRVTLPLSGRVDRIVELPGGWQVDDYKASPGVAGHVQKATVLQGRALQGLAYLLLLRGWAQGRAHPRAEHPQAWAAFLPVHPAAAGFEPSRLDMDDLEASWSETLAVLEAAWSGGAFALRKGGCSWCAFRPACRQDHGPTQERMGRAAEWGDYLLISRKSSRKGSQTLADIRAALAGGGQPADEEDA